jgi:hypothetical protein
MKSIHHGDPEFAEFGVFSLKNSSQRPPRLGGAISGTLLHTKACRKKVLDR